MIFLKIYTTYFARIRGLPEDIEPIAICLKVPDWYVGKSYNQLAPKADFFYKWKSTQDNDYYVREFNRTVLEQLNIDKVISDLQALAGDKSIALVCYEAPHSFCHRHLVADWLNKNGIECEEYNSALTTS